MDSFEEWYKALQEPNILDEKVIKQFENIYRKIKNQMTIKNIEKQSTIIQGHLKRIMKDVLFYLQEELKEEK